jgi:hypothetical protein
VALFLAGDAAFRGTMGLRPLGFRAGAAPVVLATAFLGVRVSVAGELVTLVAVLVAMLGAEARWGVRAAEVREPAPA